MIEKRGILMKKIILYVIVMITIFILDLAVFAGNTIQWSRNNEFGKVNFNGITYNGSNMLVAVGDDGRIKTSSDGLTWTGRESGTIETLTDVVYGNGMFVAVGEGIVSVSCDAVNWKSFSSLTLKSVDYDGNKFVAVGRFGASISSIDGEKWDDALLKTKENLTDVYCFEGKQMVVDQIGNFYLCEDGVEWKSSLVEFNLPLNAVCTNGSVYICATSNGSIMYSADGKKWGKVLSGFNSSPNASSDMRQNITDGNTIVDIGWDGIRFIAVGDKGTIITSIDGKNWMRSTSNIQDDLKDISCRYARYYAVGNNGAIVNSKKLDSWSSSASPNFDFNANSVVWGKNKFVLVGENGIVMSSYTGEQWQRTSYNGKNSLHKVIWTGKNYIAVGNGGTIITSKDGSKWSEIQIDVKFDINSIACNGKIYVATGVAGEVISSIDGAKWTVVEQKSFTGIDRVLCDGINFSIFDSESQRVLLSRDGVNWSEINRLKDGFVEGNNGEVCICPEAENINKNIPEIKNISHIIWNGTEYVGVGKKTESRIELVKEANLKSFRMGNSVITSRDGVKWSNTQLGTCFDLKGIAWNGEVLVAVGQKGTILSAVPAYIKIKINGKELESDMPPIIRKSRTLVPLRAVFEEFGLKVNFDPSTKTVTGTKNGVTVKLVIGSKTARINGRKVLLDSPAAVLRNRTIVPIRFVAESVGAKVNWDNNTRTVVIKK